MYMYNTIIEWSTCNSPSIDHVNTHSTYMYNTTIEYM